MASTVSVAATVMAPEYMGELVVGGRSVGREVKSSAKASACANGFHRLRRAVSSAAG